MALCFLIFFPLVIRSSEYPVAISFLLADLKLSTQGEVKICEVQQGIISRFIGDNFVHNGRGSISRNVQALFSQWDLPGWVRLKDIREKELARLLSENRDHWTLFVRKNELESDPKLKERSRFPVYNSQSISEYHGLLFARPKTIGQLDQFHQKFPGLIVIDEPSFKYWVDKYKMNQLFTYDSELIKCRPGWRLYSKKYSSHLTKTILQDIPADRYVIKPRGAFKGNGVIIVDRKDLEDTLVKILKKPHSLKNHDDPAFSYWSRDPFSSFLIEEFIDSEPMVLDHIDGKAYDPTMRVTFVLVYDNQKVDIYYTGAFLKFPSKAVTDQGSLNERYKSEGREPYYCEVDPDLLKTVKEQLNTVLPVFYHRMLEQR